jgi:hypothetical protein
MGILNLLSKKQGKYSIGITPDREMMKILDQQDNDTIRLFMTYLLDSGRYKEKPISELVNKNRKAIAKAITSGKTLELEEKKRLSVNGRKKYGQDYIATLTPRGLDHNASTEFFLNSYHQAAGIITRQYEIARLRRAGINRIRLSPCHDARDCQAISKYSSKIFNIDEVPALPLPECNAAYCRCWIIPVLE